MSVDEAKAYGPVREFDYVRCWRPIDGTPHTRDAVALNHVLCRSAQRIGQCSSSRITPFPLPQHNEPGLTAGDEADERAPLIPSWRPHSR